MLFIVCWSGTVAVLAHEIDWALDPALRVAPREGSRAAWPAMLDAAQAAVPGARLIEVKLPVGPRDSVQVLAERADARLARIYVDPFTAQVRGVRTYFNVQRFLRSFHMNLFFNWGAWGYVVVSLFALPLAAALVTSLLFYRRWWRRFFVLKTGRGLRTFFADLHKVSGLWSLWFVLVMAITGIWYGLEILAVSPAYPEAPKAAAHRASASIGLDQALRRTREEWPGFDVRQVFLPGGHLGEIFVMQGQAEAWLVRDRSNNLHLDPGSGSVRYRQDASGLALGARWIDTADPLHFGDFGGFGVKLVWFVFGLALCGLTLSGAYLHAKRIASKTSSQAMRRARDASTLASAGLLAVAAWRGYLEVAGYELGLPGTTPPPAVVVFVASWSIATLAILACWAWKVR